jgi:hypothetical protein
MPHAAAQRRSSPRDPSDGDPSLKEPAFILRRAIPHLVPGQPDADRLEGGEHDRAQYWRMTLSGERPGIGQCRLGKSVRQSGSPRLRDGRGERI